MTDQTTPTPEPGTAPEAPTVGVDPADLRGARRAGRPGTRPADPAREARQGRQAPLGRRTRGRGLDPRGHRRGRSPAHRLVRRRRPSCATSRATRSSTASCAWTCPGDQRQAAGAFLSKFPGFADQAALDTKLDEALDQLIGKASDGKQSFTKDIKPWFDGEFAFAVGPLPKDALSGGTSAAAADARALMLLSVKDQAAASAWFKGVLTESAPRPRPPRPTRASRSPSSRPRPTRPWPSAWRSSAATSRSPAT